MIGVFEDRYGVGAHERLIAWLQQPCVTFAEIADRFGVTRERVRQWHRRFLPDAPTGHERQRLCALHQQRRRLFGDALFRGFFQHARAHFGPGRIEPIRSRDGYRARMVLIDKRPIALRDISHRATPVVVTHRGGAEFLYVRLTSDDFLLLPASAVPPHGIRLARRPSAAYRRFMNTFAVFHANAERQSA